MNGGNWGNYTNNGQIGTTQQFQDGGSSALANNAKLSQYAHTYSSAADLEAALNQIQADLNGTQASRDLGDASATNDQLQQQLQENEAYTELASYLQEQVNTLEANDPSDPAIPGLKQKLLQLRESIQVLQNGTLALAANLYQASQTGGAGAQTQSLNNQGTLRLDSNNPIPTAPNTQETPPFSSGDCLNMFLAASVAVALWQVVLEYNKAEIQLMGVERMEKIKDMQGQMAEAINAANFTLASGAAQATSLFAQMGAMIVSGSFGLAGACMMSYNSSNQKVTDAEGQLDMVRAGPREGVDVTKPLALDLPAGKSGTIVDPADPTATIPAKGPGIAQIQERQQLIQKKAEYNDLSGDPVAREAFKDKHVINKRQAIDDEITAINDKYIGSSKAMSKEDAQRVAELTSDKAKLTTLEEMLDSPLDSDSIRTEQADLQKVLDNRKDEVKTLSETLTSLQTERQSYINKINLLFGTAFPQLSQGIGKAFEAAAVLKQASADSQKILAQALMDMYSNQLQSATTNFNNAVQTAQQLFQFMNDYAQNAARLVFRG